MAIAIMSCRKLINKCAGTKCFEVYHENKDAFSEYKDKNEMLVSFFHCVGCNETLFKDEDWQHKIKQLKNSNVKIIHMAKCIEVECDDLEKHRRILEKEGFEVVNGTHK